jgi:YVTN family beta-propeller protein
MRDTKDLLRPLDQLEPPDAWREATTRTPGELPTGPSSRSARVAAVLVSALVAAAGIVLVIRAFGGPDTRPAGAVANGKIAVAREGCDGDVFLCREPAHIVLVNPDGSGERDIGQGSTPAWSPDGSRLAFTAGDGRAIYVVDAEGMNRTAVVRCDEPDCVSVMSPTWSPDGSQLAFTAERTGRSGDDPEVDVWVVNADGTDAHAVTACRRPGCSSNFAPAWSPVGDEIAMWSMVRCGDGWGPSLRLLDLSSGDIRDVVSCVGSNGSRIAWSPDGRFLAFELNTGNGTGNIFTIPASGGSRTQVTSCDRKDCRWAYYPSWSPDGRWLLFAVKSEPEALFEVARARPDGDGFEHLRIQGFMPAWQPVPVDEDAPSPTPTGGEDEVVTPTPSPRVTATIPVGSFPRDIAVGPGAVWVSVNDFSDGGAEIHAVVRVDPATNEIVATIPVGTVGNLAVGSNAVWSIESIDAPLDTVIRIDPATNQVTETIPVGPYAFDVAVDATGVWVTRDIDGRGQSGEVIRIDPATNEAIARIPVDGRIRDVVVGEGGVWVVDSTSTLQREPALVHIDPGANEVVATIPGLASLNVAAGGGLVWIQGWLSTIDPSVGTGSGDHPVVLRIDPATDEFVGDPIPMAFFHPFAVWEGGIWFVGEDGAVARLDGTTLEVEDSVDVATVAQDSTVHAALDISTATIWVAKYQEAITRIDLS